MKKHSRLSLWLKWAVVLIVLSSFVLLIHMQEFKKNDDVLAKKATQVSTLPVQMSTITGQYDHDKEESSGSSFSKRQKEDHSNNSNDDANTAKLTKETAENEKNEESKKINPSKDSEYSKYSKERGTQSTQKRNQEGTGKSTNTQEKDETNLQGKIERKKANAKEIISGRKDENPYFTTSIQNNETVSKATYSFSIIHKNNKLKISKIVVRVNDLVDDAFSGKVKLKQGENRIVIQVQYEGIEELVERQYTVYYAENKLIIRTNLQDGMTTNYQSIKFNGSSYFNENEYPVQVKLSDEILVENEEGQFEASLLEGKNRVTFFAEKNGEVAQKTIHIQYEKKVNRIKFDTDLQNKRVSSAEFSFYATASLNGKQLDLNAVMNNEKLQGRNDLYFDLLKDGKNTIEISAKVDGEIEKESYTIYYEEPEETSNLTVPDDKNGPIIKTDLKNGTQIRGSIKNINVWATDNAGKRLQASHVAVVVNGKGIGFIWDDQEKTSYKLSLREGENKVVIKGWDEEGRITSKSFKIYAKNIDEGNVIGQATISLEATTLGLGNLIKPVKVELHEGEKASYVIDQYLRANQFTYTNTGTLDENFYLAAISKENITKGLKIPTDLAKIVEKEAEYFEPTDYSANQISEFTISNGSGWMYSINGDYPNYGLSDAYLLDGDIVRIRFTLFYGADIGGYGAKDNSSNDDGGTSKNVWNKQW